MGKTLIHADQGTLNGSKNITTSIPYNIWLVIKKSKTSWNSLILRGWESRNGFDGLTKRSREIEQTSKNQQNSINRMQKIIFDLNDKIEKLIEERK